MIETLNGPTLETTRLNLRPLAADDAPRMAALANDFDVARMTAVMPFPYALGDAERFIARVLARPPGGHATFAVEPDQGGLAGVIGFHPGDGLGPEIGYWLGRPYWSLGYATEALRACLAWAVAERNVRCVTAGHFTDNPASGRVLEKAGFLPTGRIEPSPCAARGEPALSRKMVWLA